MSAICRFAADVNGKNDKAGLARAKALLDQYVAYGRGILLHVLDDDEVAIALHPLLLARLEIEPRRVEKEKALTELAKQLPIAHIVDDTKGFGLLGLAGIVGEVGAIGEYRTVQGLWKRCGLAVIDGERQGRRSDPDEAALHGYAPARRSVMWNVGSALIGHLGHGPRPRVGEDIEAREDLSEWQKMLVSQLRKIAEKDPKHRKPDAERKGEVYESYSKHASNMARRFVEKQFLKRLWQEWREVSAQFRSDVHRPFGRN